MRTPPPLEFLTLGVRDRNRLGCFNEAVPDFFEQLQPIGNTEPSDLLANGAHDWILCFSFSGRKSYVSTDNV